MKREYHLSKEIAFNMAFEITKQYGANLLDASGFEIWNIKLSSYSSGSGMYVCYKYLISISYFNMYKRKYVKETLELEIGERSDDGFFITNLINMKDC